MDNYRAIRTYCYKPAASRADYPPFLYNFAYTSREAEYIQPSKKDLHSGRVRSAITALQCLFAYKLPYFNLHFPWAQRKYTSSFLYNSCSALHCNITRRSCFSCLLCSTITYSSDSPMYLKYSTNSTSITLLQKPKNKRVYKDMVRLFNARDWLTSGTVSTMCH